jgi:hypothetical protein
MSATAYRFCKECAVRPCQLQACIQRARLPCPVVQRRCCRIAAAHASGLHSVVQTSCRQRAAPAAPSLLLGQRCAPGAWLAVGRSWERMRKAETEGKIKGRGTSLCGNPGCTWGWRGTRRTAAACRQSAQCRMGIGESACFARPATLGFDEGAA